MQALPTDKGLIHQNYAKPTALSRLFSPNKGGPEDVLKVDADEEGRGGDDAADALRYLLATKRPQPRVAVVCLHKTHTPWHRFSDDGKWSCKSNALLLRSF